MNFEFKPSFERSIKALDHADKEEIKRIALYLINILSQDRALHQGIGLKRLQGPYWEVRKGIKTRILFRWQKDFLEFILAGDHGDIKKFLKSI